MLGGKKNNSTFLSPSIFLGCAGQLSTTSRTLLPCIIWSNERTYSSKSTLVIHAFLLARY
ncbi:hypothetical protein MtrunA17_Chr4g0013701 [Medicago truncatula]|uniref:Uncharacterized protein n=1 Tax=Medicago truncatula TaxID=3880 RepID=A0A396I9E6_MEDTR|nr:hypothetical protein MtrunA17_Chr4g0013701 [Medicago truncatula]